LSIDETAARRVLKTDIGDVLGLDAAGAAAGVSDIVDENMANAARMHGVESGKDLGRRTMIAFGGNGPLHATRVARRAGIDRIIVPPDPGVGSAVGFLYAPVSFEIVRSYYTTLDNLVPDDINELFEGLIADAEDVVRSGAPDGELTRQRAAFMRYRGQGHEIEVSLADRPMLPADIDGLRTGFETEYRRQFARAVPGMVIEILNWSVRVSSLDQATLATSTAKAERARAPANMRSIRCDVTDQTVEAGLHHRADLQPGDQVTGPALIIEPQTTTLVSRDFTAGMMDDGSLVLNRVDEQETGA
ncbi:MAG: hydantoinase/oxoprolinase family protein, partial [Aestuariivirgaceae bacterium]